MTFALLECLKVKRKGWKPSIIDIGKFCSQEGACEIPVPKWSDQGDALDLHLKKPLNFDKLQFLNRQIMKIHIFKLLNFENSHFFGPLYFEIFENS